MPIEVISRPESGAREIEYKEWYGRIVRFYLDHFTGQKPKKEVLDAFMKSTGLKMWDASNVLSGKTSLPQAMSEVFTHLSVIQMESILKAFKNSDAHHEKKKVEAPKILCVNYSAGKCALPGQPPECPSNGTTAFEKCGRFKSWGRCAIFVDLDNVRITLAGKKQRLRFDDFMKHVVRKGRIDRKYQLVEGKVYGESHLNHDVKDWVKKEGLTFVDCESQLKNAARGTAVTEKYKNRGDIRIVIEAMELLYEKKDAFDTFILVSGDSDFRLLLVKMKNRHKNVIVYSAIEALSQDLRSWADEVYLIEKENMTSIIREANNRGE